MAEMAVLEEGISEPYKVAKIRPPVASRGKVSQLLFKTEALSLGVQVVAEGGETNLHAHAGQDAAWVVLDGEATFYREGDEVIAKLGRFETLMIPHGAPYWFQSTSDTPLVILRFGAMVSGVENERVNYTPKNEKPRQVVAGSYFGS